MNPDLITTLFPNLHHVSPPHFIINKDGQLQVVNPLNTFQTGDSHSATTSTSDGVNTLDLQASLSKGLSTAVEDSITTPFYDFLKNNQVNLIIGFVGILVLLIGILETKAL